MNKIFKRSLMMGILILAGSSQLLSAEVKGTDTEIQLLRNATMRIKYNGKTILTDPLLAPKNSYYGFLKENSNRLVSPTSELPISAEEAIKDVDAVLVSHTHIPEDGKLHIPYSDHFDEKAIEVLSKDIPLLVQPFDRKGLETVGFQNITTIEDKIDMEGISIERFGVKHIDIDSLLPVVGEVSGYVLKAEKNPTIFWTGDTVLTADLKKRIKEVNPDIIIIHPAKAQLPLSAEEKKMFESMGMTIEDNIDRYTLLLGAEEAIEIAKLAPKAKVIAVHMESTDHSTVTRTDLKEKIKKSGVTNIIIPENGEVLKF
ncbi:MAG: MBL fold metallo-hydrolase, partial [Fusobacteriaceae bacterium]